MRAFERKFGFLEVVELRRLPAGGRVAFIALDAAALRMRVVGGMAGDALLGGVLVAVPEVTCHARYVSVFIVKRELRLVVIEFRFVPSSGFMATAAIVAELVAVRIVLAMTIDAATGSVAILLAGLMTASAIDERVLPVQWVVGVVVWKSKDVHAQDIGIASQVFRMTGAALRTLDAG